MLQFVPGGVWRNAGGILLVAGVVGVLAGVEHLLWMRRRQRLRPAAASPARVSKPAPARFRITQTKSEIGYAYWVLRGLHDQSYALFDTWPEAMAAAQSRLVAASEREQFRADGVFA